MSTDTRKRHCIMQVSGTESRIIPDIQLSEVNFKCRLVFWVLNRKSRITFFMYGTVKATKITRRF